MGKLNNIVVISGGSGNDAFITGVKNLYPDVNIDVIINAYDSGKSTGVCRKITNTLGVSDIRKNHIRMYKTTTDVIDNRLVEFYESRYTFYEDSIVSSICTLLDKWGLSNLSKYASNFFTHDIKYPVVYYDFNVANIIYSQMYHELGYAFTNNYFCKLLGIDDFVTLNSFDNIYIEAVTKSGEIISDEGKIVEYKNSLDPIKDIVYVGESKHGLNSKAIKLIENADLILISTGTFWSSIYPTLSYLDFYKYINSSDAVKIWAMNNEEDSDSYGVTSNDFISVLEHMGLNLHDFIILENLDAVSSLRLPNDKCNIEYRHMGNSADGKHDGDKYAKEVLRLYYGINVDGNNFPDYTMVITDFDDTLWSRDSSINLEEFKTSVNNLKLLHEASHDFDVRVISGNSYDSIKSKLYYVFGSDLSYTKFSVWANANSTLFYRDKKIDFISYLTITESSNKLIKYLNDMYNITATKDNDTDTVCLKIKPLANRERVLLADLLNNYVFNSLNIHDCKAVITGKTTVDIINKDNTKAVVYNHLELNTTKVLYIGDEVDKGNDSDIAKLCTTAIHTSGVQETNVLLKLLGR